ncbi:hypothetical protein [Cellulomonas phragmiteti]|uniref:DUF3040 domain-containing protein n=1 Tax=Cellulomonas phragmiteti TaxID=478780 RepID=A0ABQ4DL09_9CELL|nr:hypothetical protein [Cellulomonas phragmiteti]GIG40033.1 hypothetical protein Cph01nite_17950 [Cellulomonas phragmiteti]
MDARPDDDAEGGEITGAQHPTDRPEPPDDDRPAPPPAGATPPRTDDDEVWASIVARLSDDDGGTDPAVLRSLFGAQDGAPDPGGAPDDGLATGGPARPVGRDWDGTTQYDAAEDAVDELEHFVPADPGPVTSGDPLLTLAWGAAAGVPLFMLVAVTVWRDAPALLVRAALVVFVVAVGVLVWRMPQRRDPSDDDGAVV